MCSSSLFRPGTHCCPAKIIITNTFYDFILQWNLCRNLKANFSIGFILFLCNTTYNILSIAIQHTGNSFLHQHIPPKRLRASSCWLWICVRLILFGHEICTSTKQRFDTSKYSRKKIISSNKLCLAQERPGLPFQKRQNGGLIRFPLPPYLRCSSSSDFWGKEVGNFR